METWCRRFLLTTLLVFSHTLMADNNSAIYQPDEGRIILHESDIDAQDIELGLYAGIISIQDFGTNTITGLGVSYHISEDFFFTTTMGEATLKKTSFEKLNPGFELLSEDERKYRYYNIGMGYNLFQGESFLLSHAFNSAFYLTAAAGSTRFAGDRLHTITWGFGYRVVFLDWLATHISARDHIFKSDVFAEDETFHSVELALGLSVFF